MRRRGGGGGRGAIVEARTHRRWGVAAGGTMIARRTAPVGLARDDIGVRRGVDRRSCSNRDVRGGDGKEGDAATVVARRGRRPETI